MNKIVYNNNIKGFSIAEVCIVCAIMGVLLVPIFTLMSKSNSGTIRNKNEIFAREYASNYLSYFSMCAFDDEYIKATEEKPIPLLEVTPKGKEPIVLNNVEDSFKKIATVTFSIKDFQESPSWPYNYKLVTIYVNWQQPGEPKRSITMSGIITE